MSLSATERAELLALAQHPAPPGWPGIHFLAALYTRYGSHAAREVTDVIGEATSGWRPGYFSGFIASSDSSGFHPSLADPDPANPQTGHFFSYVMWALDGISEFEAAAALGHEFVADYYPGHEAAQLLSGAPQGAAFRDYLTQIPLDPNGVLDYGAMDGDFSAHGWSEGIIGAGRAPDFSTPFVIATPDEESLTGNSLPDLRCTVAGFHFGRLVRSGLFRTASESTAWLARNVLDGPARTLTAADIAAAAAGR